MRSRLHLAIKRGRLAVLDIGSSKITCLVLKLDPARLAEVGRDDHMGTSLFGAIEVVGARTVQSRGVRRGEIVDMDEVCRSIRLALLNSEKMAAPKVGRVDQVIVSFSGGKPQSFSTSAEVETETGQVTERDISNVLGACPPPPIGEARQILHAQPVEITVDYQNGITDPRGMTGQKLAVAMHVLTVEARPLSNLMECIRQCDLDLAGVVCAPYASGLSALVEDEQRTGAVCIDMGGGSTSFSVFLRDHLICVEQIRYGGDHVTSDIAAGLLMRSARGFAGPATDQPGDADRGHPAPDRGDLPDRSPAAGRAWHHRNAGLQHRADRRRQPDAGGRRDGDPHSGPPAAHRAADPDRRIAAVSLRARLFGGGWSGDLCIAPA
jgi:cell division protein FtsA